MGANASSAQQALEPPTPSLGPRVFLYDIPLSTRPYLHPSCLRTADNAGMFSLEYHIHQLLLRHPARTSDPEAADFFFVPAYPVCAMHLAARRTASVNFSLGRAVVAASHAAARAAGPWLDRRAGADHIWVITHGKAAALTPPELKRAVRLLCNGDDRLRRPQDVILPAAMPSELLGSTRRQLPLYGHRPWLAVFQGTVRREVAYSHGVRQAWRDRYAGGGRSGRMQILEGGGKAAAAFPAAATRSSFCLCPPGWSRWTPRPGLALLLGCVPAVFVDKMALPLGDVVDWGAAALRFAQADAPRAEELLLAVEANATRLAQMQLVGAAVADWLTFNPDYSPRSRDITLGILLSLCSRMRRPAIARVA